MADETTSGNETPVKEAPKGASPKDERQDAGKERRSRRAPRVSASQVAHGAKVGSDAIRNRVASIVWIIASACAVILILAALAVALGAESTNPIVEWLRGAADVLAGPFGGLHKGVFEFQEKSGADDTVKNALVNWGLAAMVYLVAGRILSRIIRP